LAPLGGAPLLGRPLDVAGGQGFSRAVVNVHHLQDRFQGFDWPNWTLAVSREEQLLGTAGGVRRALGELSDPCIVWNGDIVAEPPLRELLEMAEGGGLCF